MISIVVTTYNDPQRLRLVLHSLLRQNSRDFELLVVNDGGLRAENQPVYDELACLGLTAMELWLGPETTEFRLSEARNTGLKHTKGERTLFLDGDGIIAPNVVREHLHYGAENVLVSGARKHIPESCLNWLEPEHFHDLDRHVTSQDRRHHITTPSYRNLRNKLLRGETRVELDHHDQVWAFQLSVPTSLARQIGGFNEEFRSWGFEDQEFAARMKKIGTQWLGRFDLMSYHIDHPQRVRGDNLQKMFESVDNPDPVRNGGPLPQLAFEVVNGFSTSC